MKIDEFDPSQTVILRPSRLKWIGVFLICAVFTVIGVLMIRDGAMKGAYLWRWAGDQFSSPDRVSVFSHIGPRRI